MHVSTQRLSRHARAATRRGYGTKGPERGTRRPPLVEPLEQRQLLSGTLPEVTLTVPDADVSEGFTSTCRFLFARSGPTDQPLTVHYGASGTATNGLDYQRLNLVGPISGAIVIPAGTTLAALTLEGTFDNLIEGNESIIISVQPSDAYAVGQSSSGTATIVDSPVADAQSLATREDTAAIIALSGTSAYNQNLTFNVTSLPAHGQLSDGATPITSASPASPYVLGASNVRYTPATDYVGPDGFNFRLRDAGVVGAVAGVSINVTSVNDAPSATLGANQSIAEDAGAQSIPGWASNIRPGPANESGQTVAFTVANDNVALFAAQPSLDAGGNLFFTPAANASGVATVSVTLKDNGGTADGGTDTSGIQTFTITVNAVADAPTLASAPAAGDEGSAIPLNISSALTDTDGSESLSIALGGVPAGGSLSAGVMQADGTWLLSPGDLAGLTFTAADNGVVDLTVTAIAAEASNGDIESTAGVLAVTVNNFAPTMVVSGAAVDEGSVFIVNVGTVTDPGADTISQYLIHWGDGESTTLNASDVPVGQTVGHLYADGGLGGTARNVSVDLTDEDGTYASAGTTVVTVNNVAPTANGDGYATPFATPVSGNVIAGNAAGAADSDPAGANDPLTITSKTQPANGTLVMAPDGSFTYTPASTFSGVDTFTYTIGDGDGGTASATVTLTVAAAPGGVITIPDICLGGTALLVAGTAGNDDIHVSPGSTGATLLVSVNGITTTQARPGGRIIVFAGGGDDNVQVAGGISNSVWLYGEGGNDRLDAGNDAPHGNLLIGGDGNDDLLGGNGRDVMIGGQGGDKIVGNANDDVLMAGYTTRDRRSDAGHDEFWCDVLLEWSSGNTFQNRVHNLKGDGAGTQVARNGSSYLNGTTLRDDTSVDQIDMLNGSSGNDWFIYQSGEDKVVGESSAEKLIDTASLS